MQFLELPLFFSWWFACSFNHNTKHSNNCPRSDSPRVSDRERGEFPWVLSSGFANGLTFSEAICLHFSVSMSVFQLFLSAPFSLCTDALDLSASAETNLPRIHKYFYYFLRPSQWMRFPLFSSCFVSIFPTTNGVSVCVCVCARVQHFTPKPHRGQSECVYV